MARIPYGISNFAAMRERRLLFVDQTRYLHLLEEQGPDHVLFLRPRRFGKSLWISILEHYYDLRFADRFAELFGGLDIGHDPTSLHNRFLVLRLDFSTVDTSGDDGRLHESLTRSLAWHVRGFLADHQPWLEDGQRLRDALEGVADPVHALRCALEAGRQAGLPLYVLIDEYDSFTNELVASQQEARYKTLVHGTGLLKTFFKAIKEATGTGVVARTFTTGINPLLLSDLTSGFNIARNLGAEPEYAELLGFGLEDVRGLLAQVGEGSTAEAISELGGEAQVLELMAQWYDGYRFCPGAPARFNPDMVLYMLQAVVLGRLPRELVDFNLASDVGKLDLVVRKAGDLGRLWAWIEGQDLPGSSVVDRFGVDDLTDPVNFDSLLYYLGFLSYTEDPRPRLRVPNYVVRTLCWEQLRKLLQRSLGLDHFETVRVALHALMGDGEGETFFRLVREQVLALAVPRDLIHLSEAAIKTACLALLSLSTELMVFSEWATHRGYADLVLIPAPQSVWLERAWMIELKYLGKSADTPVARQQALAEGRAQIARYCQDEQRLAYLSRWTLHKAVVLFVGIDEVVWEPVA